MKRSLSIEWLSRLRSKLRSKIHKCNSLVLTDVANTQNGRYAESCSEEERKNCCAYKICKNGYRIESCEKMKERYPKPERVGKNKQSKPTTASESTTTTTTTDIATQIMVTQLIKETSVIKTY